MKDYWMDLMSEHRTVFITLRCQNMEGLKEVGELLVDARKNLYARGEFRDHESRVLFRLSKETGFKWKTLDEIAAAEQR